MVVNGGDAEGHERVKSRGRFEMGSDPSAGSDDRIARGDRYDLVTALRIVQRMETSPARGAVFAEIKEKNSLFRIVDAIYAKSGSGLLQPLFLFLYMVKCVVSLGPSKGDTAQAVSVSSFDNERHTVDR